MKSYPVLLGMIINHDKDPYQTTRVCGSTVDGDGCEQVLWVKCSRMTRWPSSTQLASFHTDFWKVSSLYCNIPWSPDISCVSILIHIYIYIQKNIYPTPITPPSRTTTASPSLLAGLGGNLAKPQPSTTPGSRHGAAAAATGTARGESGAAAAVAVSHGETSETSECGDSSQGAKGGWWWWWDGPVLQQSSEDLFDSLKFVIKWEDIINKHALGYEYGQHVQVSFCGKSSAWYSIFTEADQLCARYVRIKLQMHLYILLFFPTPKWTSFWNETHVMRISISIHFFQENPKKTSVPHLIPSFFPAPYVRYAVHAVPRLFHFRMHAVWVWKNGRQQLLRFRDYDLQTWRRSDWGWWFSGNFFHLCNAWFWGGNIYIYRYICIVTPDVFVFFVGGRASDDIFRDMYKYIIRNEADTIKTHTSNIFGMVSIERETLFFVRGIF